MSHSQDSAFAGELSFRARAEHVAGFSPPEDFQRAADAATSGGACLAAQNVSLTGALNGVLPCRGWTAGTDRAVVRMIWEIRTTTLGFCNSVSPLGQGS